MRWRRRRERRSGGGGGGDGFGKLIGDFIEAIIDAFT